jgi:hypothetical protein
MFPVPLSFFQGNLLADILRDPLWQFIGVVIALVAILISIILFIKSRNKKVLSYGIISTTPLLSVGREIKKDVQILYKDKPIQQVHLILLKLINSGNVPVTANDFERPFSIVFSKDAKVIAAEIVKTQPESLRASILFEDQKVVLEPILINEGDSITFKMLVSKLKGGLKVDGRVVGVKEIRELSGKSFPRWVGLVTASIIAAISGFVSADFGTAQFVHSFLIGALISLITVGIAGLSYFLWQMNNHL